jgi:hypothetical protein
LLLTSPWPKHHNFLENPLSRATVPLPDKLQPDVDVDGFTELSCVQKFIVCSSNLVVATTIGSTAPNPLIACCRPGMSSWSTSSHGGSCYQDIAFYHGGIYAVTTGGDLFKHEVSMDDGDGEEATVSSAKQVIKGGDISALSRFLVVSRGKLLMVNHEKCHGALEGYVFKVFEADLEMARWSQLTSLDDQVLFLSRRCSKAIPASSHDEYLYCGDRIYFLDDGLHGPIRCQSRSGLTSCGMYDLRDNTYCPIMSDRFSVGEVTAWFFPNIGFVN